MKRYKIRIHHPTHVAVVILSVAFLLTATSSFAQDANEPAKKGNHLAIAYEYDPEGPHSVIVELFHKGHRRRATELTSQPPGGSSSAIPNRIVWDELPDGDYEVHASQVGYDRSIYRILVTEHDVDRLSVRVVKNATGPIGAGPSFQELLEELAHVNKSNRDLNERVKRLEATIAALRAALSEE